MSEIKNKRLRILFVASELTPIAKVGGLGDVIGSLSKALSKLGVEVAVVLPRYEQIKNPGKLILKNFPVGSEKISIYQTFISNSKVKVFLVENKKYLSRGPIYFSKTAFVGSVREIERFKFFSQSVFNLLRDGKLPFKPDVVHCNDWHTGFLAKLLKSNSQFPIYNYQLPKVVFTIHNLANQGIWGKENWMAEGIKNADFITTVSPTYAGEILTPKFGEGLQGILRKKAKVKKLTGILNGVDYDFWKVPARRREDFQKELGLRTNNSAPIFGLVSRLTGQKGINLILPLISQFIRQGAQFAFLGQGRPDYEKKLKDLAKKYSKEVFVEIGFNEKLAHRIYAQSDFFLMPSLFEPCGLGQLIAMHYGTIPIVHATGGLKDTVQHKKTGFVMRSENKSALEKEVLGAMIIFQNKRKLEQFRKRAKNADFSWSKSAQRYLEIYKSLA